MKEKIRIVFWQTLLICFLTLICMTVSGTISHFKNPDFGFSWNLPLSLVTVSFLSSLPTLLLFIKVSSRFRWIMLVILHYILVTGVVMTSGYLLHWYVIFGEFLYVLIAFSFCYIIVWIVSNFILKHDEKVINAALDSVRDEE